MQQSPVERTMEIEQDMDPKWIRRNGVVVWATFATSIIVGACSVFWPVGFHEIVQQVCLNGRVICLDSSRFYDRAILSSFGFGEYAVGFEALRSLALVLATISTLVACLVVSLSRGYRRVSRHGLTMTAGAVAFFGVIGWWVFVSRDFYFAVDEDFTGAFRPPYGSFVFTIAVVFFGMGLPGVMLIIAKFLNWFE